MELFAVDVSVFYFLGWSTWSFLLVIADEMPIYASSDERVVELQGESLKVLKALEAVVGHLRKFLVDQSILPLFEKSVSMVPVWFIAFWDHEAMVDVFLLFTV